MIDVISLYEDLKKYVPVTDELEQLFYDAPEGDAQIDIVVGMLQEIIKSIKRKEREDQ